MTGKGGDQIKIDKCIGLGYLGKCSTYRVEMMKLKRLTSRNKSLVIYTRKNERKLFQREKNHSLE